MAWHMLHEIYISLYIVYYEQFSQSDIYMLWLLLPEFQSA